MKRTTTAVGIALTALVGVGLVGCAQNSGGGEGSDGSGTVTVISNSGINSDWIDAVIPLFEAKYPNITVTQDAVEGQTLLTSATTLYASSDAPDVGFIQTNYPGYSALIAEGALTNVDDVWDSSGMTDASPQSTSDYWTVDGAHYGLASYQVWTPVIYYNKAMFEEAGITAPDDHTLTAADFETIVKKLQAAGMQPLAVGGSEFGGYHLIAGLMQSESKDLDEYTNFLTNTQPGSTLPAEYSTGPLLDSLNTVKKWNELGVFANGTAGIGVQQAQSLFASGGAAMLTDGSWAAGAAATAAPDLDFGWFMYPTFKTPTVFLTAPDNGMAIPKQAKNPVGAKLFLEFLGGKEAQALVASAAGSIPIRQDLGADALTGLAPQVAEMLTDMARIGASDFWLPSGSVTEAVTSGFGQILTGEKTPQEVADIVQQNADDSRAATQ